MARVWRVVVATLIVAALVTPLAAAQSTSDEAPDAGSGVTAPTEEAEPPPPEPPNDPPAEVVTETTIALTMQFIDGDGSEVFIVETPDEVVGLHDGDTTSFTITGDQVSLFGLLAPPGWRATAFECVGGTGTYDAILAEVFLDIVPDTDATSVECALTSARAALIDLTIRKWAPDADPHVTFEFEAFDIGPTGTGPFSLGHDEAHTIRGVEVGSEWNIFEDAPPGWRLIDVSCTPEVDDLFFDPLGTASVTVRETDTTCTFTNKGPAKLSVTKEVDAAGVPFDPAQTFRIGPPGDARKLAIGETADFPIAVGTVTLREQPEVGWELASVTCTGLDAADVAVDLAGASVTLDIVDSEARIHCTFVNRPIAAARVTIAVEASTPTNAVESFEFHDSSGQVNDLLGVGQQGTYEIFASGPYTITQVFEPDSWWAADSVDCGAADQQIQVGPLGSEVTFLLSAGSEVHCTFVNAPPVPALLTVRKIVEDAEPAPLVTFPIDIEGIAYEVADGESVTVEVTRTGPLGVELSEDLFDRPQWLLVDIECGGRESISHLEDRFGSVWVDIRPGERLTCTVTNAPAEPATIRVTKLVEGTDSSDESFPFVGPYGHFSLRIGETHQIEVDPHADVYITEELGNRPGWLIEAIECSVDGRPTGEVFLTDPQRTVGQVGLFPGSGDDIECVFTNRLVHPSTLSIVKVLAGRVHDDILDMEFEVTIDDRVHLVSPESPVDVEIQAGVHLIEERLPLGWEFTSWDCEDDAGHAVESSTPPILSVTVGAQVDVICTITNTYHPPARVTIRKQVQSSVEEVPDDSFGFAEDRLSPSTFALRDGEEFTFMAARGRLELHERYGELWTLTDVHCSGASSHWFRETIVISVPEGGDVECTVTNTYQPFAFLSMTLEMLGGSAAPDGSVLSVRLDRDSLPLLAGEPVTFPIGSLARGSVTIPAAFVLDDFICDGEPVNFPPINPNGSSAVQFGFTAELGQTIACDLFVRRAVPSTLSITKEAAEGAGAPSSFSGPAGNFELGPGERHEITVFAGPVEVYERQSPDRAVHVDCGAADWSEVEVTTSVGARVLIEEGADAECTFTGRILDTATITVTKLVEGMPPPGVDAARFNFFLDGNILNLGSDDTVSVEVRPGWSTLWEEVDPNHTLQSVECEGAVQVDLLRDGASVLTEPGDEVHCTFTNVARPSQVAGRLTITKEVIGGEGDPSRFQFQWFASSRVGTFELADGDSEVLEVTEEGVVRIIESPMSGYEFASVWCDRPGVGLAIFSGFRVAVEPGDDLTCVVSNRPVRPAIVTVVVETTAPADGAVFNFGTDAGTISLSSGESAAVPANGILRVESGSIAGWNLIDIDCPGGNRIIDPRVVLLATQPGADYRCAFVFAPAPTSTVALFVATQDGSDLTVTFDSPEGVVEAAPGAPNILAVRPGYVSIEARETVTHRLVELRCTALDWDRFGFLASLHVVPGEEVTCTFVYETIEPAIVTVAKSVQGFDSGSWFEFTTVTHSFELRGGEEVDVAMPIGLQRLVEAPSQGWELARVECNRLVGVLVRDRSIFGSGGYVVLDLAPGDRVRCEFANVMTDPPETGWLTMRLAVDGTSPSTGGVDRVSEALNTQVIFHGPDGRDRALADGDSYTHRIAAGVPQEIDVELPPGWSIQSFSCDGVIGHDRDGGSLSLTVEAMGDADCVLRTESVRPPVLAVDGENGKDGPISADPGRPMVVAIDACAGGEGVWTLVDGAGTPVATGALAEVSPGSYLGEVEFDGQVYVPGVDPGYVLTVSVQCGDLEQSASVEIDYIDPEGVVIDCAGRPVDGAVVTLLRSDAESGPFLAVAQGDVSVLDPSVNLDNPDRTGPDGRFQWFTTAGWYRIQADYGGVTTITDPLPVPPPQLGLVLVLDDGSCGVVGQFVEDFVVPVSNVTEPIGAPMAATGDVEAPLAHTGAETRTILALAAALVGLGSLGLGSDRLVRRRRRHRRAPLRV